MSSSNFEEISFTLKRPLYTYLHLRATGQKSGPLQLDEISVRQYLVQAMTQYLGLTGSAVSIDVLKVDRQDAWVRLATEDEAAVVTSLSQWSGKGIILTVRGRSSWLGALTRQHPRIRATRDRYDEKTALQQTAVSSGNDHFPLSSDGACSH